jgi:curved DNA-binding protein CbpA
VADYYEVLGIKKEASAAEVRQAYLRLVRDRHPDRFQDPAEKEKAQELLKSVTEAFNTLSNDKKRQEYDKESAKPKVTVPAEIAAAAHARGVAHLQKREFHEAVTLLRTAVENAPEVARYHADLGRTLSNNPNWVREAVDELDKAIKLEPKNPGFYMELARILAGQGLKLRALRAAENALRLVPTNPTVQQFVAELRGEGGAAPEPGPAGRKP